MTVIEHARRVEAVCASLQAQARKIRAIGNDPALREAERQVEAARDLVRRHHLAKCTKPLERLVRAR